MNDEKMTFKGFNEKGEEVEYEIMLSFYSEETAKHYIIYSDNTYNEDDKLNICASTFDPNDNDAPLCPIETDEEWELIEAVLYDIQHESDNE